MTGSSQCVGIPFAFCKILEEGNWEKNGHFASGSERNIESPKSGATNCRKPGCPKESDTILKCLRRQGSDKVSYENKRTETVAKIRLCMLIPHLLLLVAWYS